MQRRTERWQATVCAPDACLIKGKGWEGGLTGKLGEAGVLML